MHSNELWHFRWPWRLEWPLKVISVTYLQLLLRVRGLCPICRRQLSFLLLQASDNQPGTAVIAMLLCNDLCNHVCLLAILWENSWPCNGHIKSHSNGPLYSNMVIGTLAIDRYIWYIEEGLGWAAAPSSPLLAVPNVTPHPSTANVPTSYY